MTTPSTTTNLVQQSTDVAEFLRLLHPPGVVFETRAPNTSDRSDGRYASTYSGYFTDPELAAKAIASDIPEFAPAIYVTMNPVMPDLLARADNCIKSKAKVTTQDGNILKRRWLFFDIDPKRPAGISSTDAETREAMDLARSLRAYLDGEGWPEPLRGMSGNGIYLLYRIDLPVDDDGLIRSVLESLAERFDSDKAEIDAGVYNPSRIVKVLGTIARKGTDFKGNGEAEARPHRRSWFFPPEQSLTPVSIEQLQQVVSANPTTKTTRKASSAPRRVSGFDQFEHTADGVEGYLVKHGVEVRTRKPRPNGTMLILNRCPVHPDIEDHDGSSIGVLVDDSGKISYGNWHQRAGGLAGTQWIDVREALEPGYKAFSEQQRTKHMNPSPSVRVSPAPASNTAPAQDLAKLPDGFHLTEHGNSERIVARHGRDLLYCDPWARWLVWDGRRWKPDEGRRIDALAIDTVKSIYAEAADEQNTARRKALADWGQRCETGHHVRQIIALSRHRVPVLPDQLDIDPWLFNLRNGTLDLRSGELRQHDRADLITKLAPVEYHADAECPRWEDFLNVVLAGNEGLIGFLQRMVGYALTGDTSERCLFILYGGGFNGKTTFIETLRGVFGDYALRTPAETLLAKRGDSIPNDVARLKGARLVTASETEDNRRFSEAFVKDLTGGDTITARFMRAEYFEFRPECKIVLATNHRPVVRGTDDAIWSRLRLVPFTVTIPEQDRDPQLRDKLIAESAGIMAWAVKGCLQWQQSRLAPPDEVTAATEVYRSDMDVLGVFIDDCCELDAEAMTSASDLYQRYKQWADRVGERPMTQRTFGLRLKERGLDNSGRMPGTRRKAWRGISLTTEFSVERKP